VSSTGKTSTISSTVSCVPLTMGDGDDSLQAVQTASQGDFQGSQRRWQRRTQEVLQ
jgi:hypothetical protein